MTSANATRRHHSAKMMLRILTATLARKRIEVAHAAFRSFWGLIRTLILPYLGERTSEVISSIMAVMARKRLICSVSSGKFILNHASAVSTRRYRVSMVSPFSLGCSCSMRTGFPVASARAVASALQRGQPMEARIFGSCWVSLHRF